MKKRVLFTCVVIGIIAILFIFYPVRKVLTVEPVDAKRPALCYIVTPGDEFTISFVHSVNKRPVYDTIRIEKDHFLVVKSRYDAFGAGMPVASDGDARLKTVADGWLELTDINLRLTDFKIFVGTIAEHSLRIHNKDFRMTEHVAPGTPVTFSINNYSIYQVWKGGCTP